MGLIQNQFEGGCSNYNGDQYLGLKKSDEEENPLGY